MALSTHGHGMAFQDRCFGVSKTSLLSKIHDFRFLFPRSPTVQAVYTGGYTQNESKASTMELYRQAREGFYLLCSLLLEPWIISMSALSFPKLPGDVED